MAFGQVVDYHSSRKLMSYVDSDLWGRGYSDTPLDVPHDSRLFTAQIFFALASSTISWTGQESGGFSMIGFSLGGGITMSFAAHFPYLVNSIILLAPAGILRRLPEDYDSFVLRYSSLVPSKYLRWVVAKILGVDFSKKACSVEDNTEVSSNRSEEVEEASATGKKPLDVPGIVRWQFEHHKGFCHSFVNTILYGPVMNQESDWVKVGNIVKGNESSSLNTQQGSKLKNSKLLVIFGDADDIFAVEDVKKPLCDILGGEEHVTIEMVSGGHGFPVPSCEEVVRHICRFWEL